MAKFEKIIRGTLKGSRHLTIESNKGYNIGDYPIGGITNEEMTIEFDDGNIYPIGATFVCRDNGKYKKDRVYRFNGVGWEDLGTFFDSSFLANYQKLNERVTHIASYSTDNQYPTAKAVWTELNKLEPTTNKSNVLNASSTNTQYPSSKAVYSNLGLAVSNGGRTRETVITDLAGLAASTIDKDKQYSISDYPEGGISSALMALALTAEYDGFFKDGDTFVCNDTSDDYAKDKMYRFTVTGTFPNLTASWVEVQSSSTSLADLSYSELAFPITPEQPTLSGNNLTVQDIPGAESYTVNATDTNTGDTYELGTISADELGGS